MRIAVLGVGRMGAPIARRLAAIAEVVAFDPDGSRLTALGPGVAVAATQDDATAHADLIVAVLPGAREQREFLLTALAAGTLAEPGALLLDLTSGHPDTARELQRTARRCGVGYVAAPMGGDPSAAASGRLDLLLGGAARDVERASGAIEALTGDGGRARHISEDAGAAALAKLLVNGLWFAQAVAVAEAVRTGEQAGLPAAVFREVLRGSAADSAFVDRYLDRLLAGDEMVEFGLDRVMEELDIVETLHRSAGIDDGVLSASHDIHARVLAASGAAGGELTTVQHVRAGRLPHRQPGRDARETSSPPASASPS